jgi:hypothetical protein
MESTQFEAFSAALTRSLESRSGVLALVLLGTTSQPEFRDEWSDHDFWVVTRPGYQDTLLNDLSWLPRADEFLIEARHGPHRRSILYSDGHLIEFAVFDVDEVSGASVTSYRIVFDRGGVAAAVAAVHANTQPPAWDEDRAEFLFSNFLILLQTAAARSRRGEQLSARRYVSHFAVDALLRLALGLTKRADAPGVDPLDPRRRIERIFPELASALSSVEQRTVPEAAIALLDIADNFLTRTWPEYPKTDAEAVRRLLTAAAMP